MADFFEQPEEAQEESSTLKIGEKEYTTDQIESMISKAQQVEELESKFNTKLDKVWPEYGKSQNRLKELESELEQLRTQAAEPKAPSDLTEDQLRQAREEAKKLGILTEDQFEQKLAQSFRQFYSMERSAEKLYDQGKELEEKIDGSDGRPKFVLEEILTHMAETGIKDLNRAYKDKYDNELEKWRAEQIRQSKPDAFVSQSVRMGSREPSPIKPNKDNIYGLVTESLGDY